MEKTKSEAERIIEDKFGTIPDNSLRNIIYLFMADAAAHGHIIQMPRDAKRKKKPLYDFIQANIDFFKPCFDKLQVVTQK